MLHLSASRVLLNQRWTTTEGRAILTFDRGGGDGKKVAARAWSEEEGWCGEEKEKEEREDGGKEGRRKGKGKKTSVFRAHNVVLSTLTPRLGH
jgi:hypothetical protein